MSRFTRIRHIGLFAVIAAVAVMSSVRFDREANANPKPAAEQMAVAISASMTSSLPNANCPPGPGTFDATCNGLVNPGDTIRYAVTITNTGDTDATGLNFADTLPNTTSLIAGSTQISPIANNDSFPVTGNVRVATANSATLNLLTNDVRPSTGTNVNLVATIEAKKSAVCAGIGAACSNNVTIAADGSFTYNPPAGYEGADSFGYTITDTTPGNGLTATGTVNLTVAGMIWFIDQSAGAGGDGRLTTPFNCLDTTAGCFAAVNDGAGNHPAANDSIFMYKSGGAPATFTGGTNLLNGQKLFGEGATQPLATIASISLAAGSDALPATNHAAPVLTTGSLKDNIRLTNGSTANTLRGFTVGDSGTAATGDSSDISGTNFGTLTVSEVTLNGSGRTLNLTGPGNLNGTFLGVSSNKSTGQGMTLSGIGGSVNLGSTTISGQAIQCISVSGVTADITFGDTSCTNTGEGIFLSGNSAGTRIFGTLSSTGGNAGAFIHSNNGAIGGGATTINGDATISTSGNAIVVSSAANTDLIEFKASTIVTTSGAGAPAIIWTGSGAASTAELKFNKLTINRNNGTALQATVGGKITVTNTLTGSSITNATAGGPAIDASNITLNANFASINSSGGANGVKLNTVSGTSDFGTTTISGSGTQGINIAGSTIAATFGTTQVTGTTTQGILIGTSTGNITFGATTVTSNADAVSFQSNSNTGKVITFSSLNATAGGAGIAFLHGTGGGNVTVTNLATLTSGSGNTIDIQNQAASTAVNFTGGATLTKTAGGTGVNLGTDNGNVTFGGTLTIGTSGARFPATAVTITGGTTGVYSLGTVSIFTNGFAGITATNADGTLNSTGGTVDVNAANAINIGGPVGITTLGMTLTTVNSTGGTNGVNLTNTGGTATLGNGAISGASGAEFLVSGSNPTVSYAGSITQNNAQRVVDIQGTTANTVTLSGTVTGGASSLGVHIGDTTAVNGNVAFTTLNLGTGARMTNQAVTITNGGSGATYSLGTVGIFTTGAAGIVATNFDGTLNLAGGTVDALTASAINVAGPAGITTLGMTLGTVNSTGGTNGVNLTNTGGSAALGNGAITGATGSEFLVNGGNSTVTYTGNITQNNNLARVVDIQNTTGGSVAFTTGTVTGGSVSSGVILNGNTGNVSFANLNLGTSGSRTANQAVTITGGSGTKSLGTVSIFTNNAIGINASNSTGAISSTSGEVNATGAAAVSIAGVSSASRTPLNIQLTKVQSTGSSSNGISIQNTSATGSPGGFRVLGNTAGICGGSVTNTTTPGTAATVTAPNTSDCSGGTITASSDGIRLVSVENVSLTRMFLNNNTHSGIFGTEVNGFELISSYIFNSGNTSGSAGDRGLKFRDVANPGSLNGLIGTATNGAFPTRIINSSVKQSVEFNTEFINRTGTLTDLLIDGCQFSDTKLNTLNLGADGFDVEMQNTATATMRIQNSFLSNNFTQGAQVSAIDSATLNFTVSSSTFTNNNEGFVCNHSVNSDLTCTVGGDSSNLGNTFASNATGASIVASDGSTTTSSGSQTTKIKFNNVNSPSGNVNHAVIVFVSGTNAPSSIDVSNNTVVNNGFGQAILVDTPDNNASPQFAVTANSNNITGGGPSSLHGVLVQARQNSTGCVLVQNNTGTVLNGGSLARVRASSVAGQLATLNLKQGVSASNVAATVIQDNNPGVTTSTSVSAPGVLNVVANGACTTPAQRPGESDESLRNLKRDGSANTPAARENADTAYWDAFYDERNSAYAKTLENRLRKVSVNVTKPLSDFDNGLAFLNSPSEKPGKWTIGDEEIDSAISSVEPAKLGEAAIISGELRVEVGDPLANTEFGIGSAHLELERPSGFGEIASATSETTPAKAENSPSTFTILAAIGDRMVSEISPTVYSQGTAGPEGSGGTINANIGTLPAGKSVTIFFDTQVDDVNTLAPNVFSISNQGTVSGGNFANVLTDDPAIAGTTNPTVTKIIQPENIQKAFNPTSNFLNGVSTLTFTIHNDNPPGIGANATQIAFTDTFQSNLVIANSTTTNLCGGTLTDLSDGAITAGDTGVKYVGGTLNAAAGGAQCTITVKVTSSVGGSYPNTTSVISSTEGATGLTSNTATLNISPLTSAGVSVSGHVLTQAGRGITNARVTITDAAGVSRTVLTGRGGQFNFDDVPTGYTYSVSVTSQRFTFAPRVIAVQDQVTSVDFTAEGN
jgi:hypothetical protein